MVMEAYRTGLVAHPKRSLVGKFFTSLRPPSFERTESILRQQWKLSRGLKVFAMEKDNIILFEFKTKRDKKKVVKGGPWNVDGIILVLKECPQDISMNDDFSVACFWVKVLGLPYFNYREADVEKIGKKISDVPLLSFKYDYSTRCFWVKAEINLKKALPPGYYIGRGRRRPFVQFKYKNLGEFCEICGMISHRKCGKAAKKRPLTREFKTHVYGPWLRYDHEPAGSNGLPVEPAYFELSNEMGLEYEETLTYAQFLVEVEVDVIYASEHEWGGKKLIRSLLVSEYDHRFRFPCSQTRVIKDVLASEVGKISPLARLTVEDKASIVHGLVDFLMEYRETWSKRRWVPLLVRVEKTIMVPPVDMETMLQEAKDTKLQETINFVVIEMVDPLLEKSDEVLLLRTIRDAIDKVGLTHQVPDFFIEMTVTWMKELYNISPGGSKLRLHPNNKSVTVLGPDMDLFGTCCICQDEYFLGEEATLTYPCSHAFHTCCLEDWIQQSQKCPLCRLQLQVLSSVDVFS